jgi:hypothetical protein
MKVYHWSPSENRKAILKEGLHIFADETIYEYEHKGDTVKEVWSAPYICTCTNAWKALCYVYPRFQYDDLIPDMDLWQIKLTKDDQVQFRNDGTIEIIEVRVFNNIPSNRVRYIASRSF